MSLSLSAGYTINIVARPSSTRLLTAFQAFSTYVYRIPNERDPDNVFDIRMRRPQLRQIQKPNVYGKKPDRSLPFFKCQLLIVTFI